MPLGRRFCTSDLRERVLVCSQYGAFLTDASGIRTHTIAINTIFVLHS